MPTIAPCLLLIVLACVEAPPAAPAPTSVDAALEAWFEAPGHSTPAEARALAAADVDGRLLPLLVARFTARGWPRVHRSREVLVEYGDRAVPTLVALLDDDRRERLEGTADLIYPGAEETYGHGWFLPIDIDWIPARAGWALEEITGRRFGFEDEEGGWPGASTEEERLRIGREAVARAKAWWASRPR